MASKREVQEAIAEALCEYDELRGAPPWHAVPWTKKVAYRAKAQHVLNRISRWVQP